MGIDEIRAYLRRRAFEPFRIVTSSGQAYDVRHPDAAILVRNDIVVAYGGDNGGHPELSAHLSALHVTAIETIRAGRTLRRRKRRP